MFAWLPALLHAAHRKHFPANIKFCNKKRHLPRKIPWEHQVQSLNRACFCCMMDGEDDARLPYAVCV